MRWWVVAGACMGAAVSSLACVVDDAFTCSEDAACVANGIGGLCQPTGYCSFPDPSCDSEQRYGEHAAGMLAGACVPRSDESTGINQTSGDTVTTQDTLASSGFDSTGFSSTATTFDEGGTSGSTFGDATTFDSIGPTSNDDSSTGFSSSNGVSTSGDTGDDTGGGEIVPPACTNVNFGDAEQVEALQPDPTPFGDHFSTDCLPGNAPDIAFFWVAPASGTYEFYAEAGEGNDVVGGLWSGCVGVEYACDDDGGDVVDSRIVRDVTAGQDFLWVVNVYGAVENGFTVYIRPVAG